MENRMEIRLGVYRPQKNPFFPGYLACLHKQHDFTIGLLVADLAFSASFHSTTTKRRLKKIFRLLGQDICLLVVCFLVFDTTW
jgi:hypothetical protein